MSVICLSITYNVAFANVLKLWTIKNGNKMKELTEKEKWYLKGYADALQRAMYELTGENTCSKSYDPISFGDGYIASYAFDLKNGGRRHDLSEFDNSGEIETLMLNQACEWIRGEFEHYIDMIKSNKQNNNEKE